MKRLKFNKINLAVIIIFLFLFFEGTAQKAPNSLDSQGRRHGLWKTFYDKDSTQIKFEGNFEHGKETGLFKFYDEGLKQPVATILFDPSTDTVEVKYLSQKGNIISEGKMINKQRIGSWKYYHKGSTKLLTEENYDQGKLQGPRVVYYESGEVAEKANYENGELHGERLLFSEKGVVLERLHYENGELHGLAQFYNGKGELLSEGHYKRDKHHGIWKYYENGKLKEEKNYSS